MAAGWYDELVRAGRMDADRLTMAYTSGVAAGGGTVHGAELAWSDPGSWDSGGMIGGHDYGGGWSGSHDLGGGDLGGGGDGGGGGGGD